MRQYIVLLLVISMTINGLLPAFAGPQASDLPNFEDLADVPEEELLEAIGQLDFERSNALMDDSAAALEKEMKEIESKRRREKYEDVAAASALLGVGSYLGSKISLNPFRWAKGFGNGMQTAGKAATLTGGLLKKMAPVGAALDLAFWPISGMESVTQGHPGIEAWEFLFKSYSDRLYGGYIKDPDYIEKAKWVLDKAVEKVNENCRQKIRSGGCLFRPLVFISRIPRTHSFVEKNEEGKEFLVSEVNGDLILYDDAVDRVAAALGANLFEYVDRKIRNKAYEDFKNDPRPQTAKLKRTVQRNFVSYENSAARGPREKDVAEFFGWDLVGRPPIASWAVTTQTIGVNYLRDKIASLPYDEEKFSYRLVSLPMYNGTAEVFSFCADEATEKKLTAAKLLYIPEPCGQMSFEKGFDPMPAHQKAGAPFAIDHRRATRWRNLVPFILASVIVGRAIPGWSKSAVFAKLLLVPSTGMALTFADGFLQVEIPNYKIAMALNVLRGSKVEKYRKFAGFLAGARAGFLSGKTDARSIQIQMAEMFEIDPSLIEVTRIN